jgi:hypothetical protein
MRYLAPFCALALVGCAQPATSTSKFSGTKKAVAQVISDLSDDAGRSREADVCGKVLSARLQKAVAGTSSCVSEVKKAFEDADATKLEVDSVTVTGQSATAVVHSTSRNHTARRTFKLIQVGGDWRIDSFGA